MSDREGPGMLVSVVYSSGGAGVTTQQALAVAEGVRSVPGVECRLVNLSTDEAPWETLESSAAIVFGSPACDGTVSAEVEQFFERATSAARPALGWRDKVAAGFASAGPRNDGALDTLVAMALFAARHGMLWVGLDLFPLARDRKAPGSIEHASERGRWLGAVARTNDGEGPEASPAGSDVRTAAYLGRRVAKTARRLARAPSS